MTVVCAVYLLGHARLLLAVTHGYDSHGLFAVRDPLGGK